MTSRWIVVAALAASTAPAHADSPDKLAVDTPAELLGGRLVVKLPKAMRLVPRGHDIMSADASPEEETRAVLDRDSARFVMMTTEVFATTGTDFAAGVATQVDKAAKLEPVAVIKPLIAYALAAPPAKFDEGLVLLSMWVGNTDGTVQLVRFYVNKDGSHDAAAWTVLARKIAATLAPGKRGLGIEAGVRKLESLAVTVPDKWVVTSQPGPDFIVFHLRPLAPLGSSGDAGSCGVYLGGYPSYQHAQAGIDAKLVHLRKGKLLGTDVSWHDWADGGIAMTEAMAPHSGGMVHVFCSAKTDAELAPVRTMMETLK